MHKALCKIIKEMLRDDPITGTGKPEPINYPAASGRDINVLNIVVWMECNGIREMCSTSHPGLRYAASRLHLSLYYIYAASCGELNPKRLKHNLSGLWSRRLSQKDRLVYKFDNKSNLYICYRWPLLRFLSCPGSQ